MKLIYFIMFNIIRNMILVVDYFTLYFFYYVIFNKIIK
nr:MAG TPA: hypothetical protein [Caudoviricetes sp.]